MEARKALAPVLGVARTDLAVRHLNARILAGCGELSAAEAEQRAVCAGAPADPRLRVELSRLLIRQGRPAEARDELRRALALAPGQAFVAVALADLLNDAGEPEAALQVLEPFWGVADAGVQRVKGVALQALGRFEEALAAFQQARDLTPGDGVAEHNLASVLADMGSPAASLAAADRARAKGLDAPESWLVRAHALHVLNRPDEAVEAYRQAIRRRPDFAQAHMDLARLVWARTGERDAALAELDALLDAAPIGAHLDLRLERANILTFAEGAEAAYASLLPVAEAMETNAQVRAAAARAALGFDPDRALGHAKAAAEFGGDAVWAATPLAESLLALGRATEAEARLATLLLQWPDDQKLWALRATALRLLGDSRYRALYDYEAMVRSWILAPPPPWPSLQSYLHDLGEALGALHKAVTHPIGQSLRHGSQTERDLLDAGHPALRAFFGMVDAPIRAYMAAIGRGDGPLRERNGGDYRLSGAWSIRLQPGGGRHVDHVHPKGWISSVFYVELPPAVEAEERQGWIKFGECGITTRPATTPEHYVKPEVGKLVLFPSYMWHGTLPFGGAAYRLTVAFDAVPA